MAHETVPEKYRCTLANAKKNHMTMHYDTAFAAAKEKGLRWYPWVGKNYDKTRILILGMSTYYKAGECWEYRWRDLCDTVNPSRVLVAQGIDSACGKRKKDRPPYEAMSKMFADAKDKNYCQRAKIFWESVAFNNYCQKVINKEKDKCQSTKKDNNSSNKKDNNRAFRETLEILKPRLCLVWTTQIWKVGFKRSQHRKCRKITENSFPRIVDQPSPIVGIRHPSRGFSPKEWLKFLREDEASKAHIEHFIAYLQSQPVE